MRIKRRIRKVRAPPAKGRAPPTTTQTAQTKAVYQDMSFSLKCLSEKRRPRKSSAYFAEMDPEDLGDTWWGAYALCRVDQPDEGEAY